jgi:hypothetical protein
MAGSNGPIARSCGRRASAATKRATSGTTMPDRSRGRTTVSSVSSVVATRERYSARTVGARDFRSRL